MQVELIETRKKFKIKVNGETRLSIDKTTPDARMFAKCRCFDIMYCYLNMGSIKQPIKSIGYYPKLEPKLYG